MPNGPAGTERRPTIFVGHPGERIEARPWLHADNAALYGHLVRVLEERGYPYRLGKVKRAPRRYDVVLAHHTTVRRPGVWNLKKGYLPGYMYWDRCGYSGWAELADSRELFERSQALDAEQALAFYERFTVDWIAAATSKFPQDEPGFTRLAPERGPFEVEEPYVFVVGQRPRDTVSKLARIGTEELAERVVRAFRGTDVRVVVKCHPQERRNHLAHLAREPHVVPSQHSIHRILPGAAAVVTVNSGVGFEALLYGKAVFTAGHCDYHWVTRRIETARDIERLPARLDEPLDRTAIARFVTFALREYFVDAHDGEAVERRLDACVEEWARGPRSRRAGILR